jgi:hypothetical protein
MSVASEHVLVVARTARVLGSKVVAHGLELTGLGEPCAVEPLDVEPRPNGPLRVEGA